MCEYVLQYFCLVILQRNSRQKNSYLMFNAFISSLLFLLANMTNIYVLALYHLEVMIFSEAANSQLPFKELSYQRLAALLFALFLDEKPIERGKVFIECLCNTERKTFLKQVDFSLKLTLWPKVGSRRKSRRWLFISAECPLIGKTLKMQIIIH